MNKKNPELSIILPCLNEENAIKKCVMDIKKTLNTSYEIIIVDNGSNDNSIKIINTLIQKIPELKLVQEERKGYGSAYIKGFKKAVGEYIYIADCDDTYDFSEIPKFIKRLKKGSDLVVGNRFGGKMSRNAMPLHKKYIGNPFLSFITRFLFKIKINDIHCGARAIKNSSYKKLSLYTTGMEFASEMIIKASKENLKISEISINYKERIGETKLKTIGDGWRHLRFMLLYSPVFLFFIPGLLLFLLGLISMTLLYIESFEFFGLTFIIHPMFLSSLFMIIGYQIIFFAGFARTYAITHLGEKSKSLEKLFKFITIEKAGVIGILLMTTGLIIFTFIFLKWYNSSFENLNELKNSITALTLTVIGIQTIFSAFMLSIIGIEEK